MASEVKIEPMSRIVCGDVVVEVSMERIYITGVGYVIRKDVANLHVAVGLAVSIYNNKEEFKSEL